MKLMPWLKKIEIYAAEQNALDTEMARLREEITASLRSVPNLRDQITRDSTQEEVATRLFVEFVLT